ncbi:MAG: hypothetical protein AMXMBFR23_01380 [Chloroflexota bacterium]
MLAAIRHLWTLVRSDRGISTVLFALVLPAVMGMQALVIDGTRLFVERRALQNAADAAALAAAAYLPSTDPQVLALAEAAAIQYAALNGYAITAADVEFTSESVLNDRVTVHTEGEVGFFFAGGLGVPLGAVSSLGSAQIGSVGGIGSVMPWGVEEPAGGFVFGQEYCLKLGSGGGGGNCSGAAQGNFHALDIDDTGTNSASEYRDRIRWGSNTVVRIGQVKDVSTGNMQGPTQQGTGCSGNSGRISGNDATFNEVIEVLDGGGYRVLDWANTRLVLIPTVVFPSAHEALVTGFTVFFVEACGPNGSVTGRFIDTVVPGGEWVAFQPGLGTRMVRLVE